VAGEMDRHQDHVIGKNVHPPRPPLQTLKALVDQLRIEEGVESVDFRQLRVPDAAVHYHLQEKVGHLEGELKVQFSSLKHKLTKKEFDLIIEPIQALESDHVFSSNSDFKGI
jgi:hypothetical protein